MIATSQPLASAAGLRILMERRKRRGRRDHRGGGAERGRADDVRHRRATSSRSTTRRKPGTLHGLNATGRAGARADAAKLRADGLTRMPGSGPLGGDRARGARRLGGTGEPLRDAAARRAAPARHPARRGGLPGVRGHLGAVEAGRRQARAPPGHGPPPTWWTGSALPNTARCSAPPTSRRPCARSRSRGRRSSTAARSPRPSTTSWRRRAAT